MFLRYGLGLFETHLRDGLLITERLVLFGFLQGVFGDFARVPAEVSEGTFGLFRVFGRLVLVLLGWFVELK